ATREHVRITGPSCADPFGCSRKIKQTKTQRYKDGPLNKIKHKETKIHKEIFELCVFVSILLRISFFDKNEAIKSTLLPLLMKTEPSREYAFSYTLSPFHGSYRFHALPSIEIIRSMLSTKRCA